MKYLAMFLLLCMTLPVMSLAQEAKKDDNMAILMEKIKADKKLLVAANLGLTEAESKDFWPLYDAYQKDLEGNRMKLGDIIKRYAEKYETMTNEEAKGLLNEYMMVDEEQLKLRQAALPKFRAVLPEIKVVRYYQIENKIRSAVNYEIAALIPLMK
jgi:hypothetical protein